jgi:hypothetical protein
LAKKSSENPKKKKAADKEMDAEIRAAMNQPWLQMRTGLIVMTIASLGITVFIAWQLVPSEGFWKGVGWGLVFGGAMWLIFIAGVWFNHWVRRGQK